MNDYPDGIVKCPRCNGKGETISITPLFAVLSLGLSALIEASCPDRCSVCRGKGFVATSRLRNLAS